MNNAVFGKTGLEISEVGFGCIPIMQLTKKEAVLLLTYAFDNGITLYDSANAYSDSEEKIGQAFKGIRNEVVIATKTGERNKEGVLDHLNLSLKRLQTDYIDLYQLHSVSKKDDWEKVSGPGGALEALRKAVDDGVVRSIGVTSHSLEMAVKLVKTGLFETIQYPYNFIETEAAEELFPLAKSKSMGILAMKPFGGGLLEDAALVYKFIRQMPGIIPIPGFYSKKEVDQMLAVYKKTNEVTREDESAMDWYRKELGKDFCRRCQYCLPCPQGVQIVPLMQYKSFVKRMSPEKAAQFAGEALETAAKCTECGKCIERCPYGLNIPKKIKTNYNLYKNYAGAGC